MTFPCKSGGDRIYAPHTSVELLPLVQRSVFVQRRGEERVRKAQRPPVAVQHPRSHCLGHRGETSADRPLDSRDRRLRERRRYERRLARARRKPCQPIMNDLTEQGGYRQRFSGFETATRPQKGGGDLERIKRVPAHRLLELAQRRAKKVRPKARSNQLIERTQGQRPHGDPLPAVEADDRRSRAQHRGCEQSNPLVAESANGELQRARRRGIQPLRVVDGDEKWLGLREPAEQLEQQRRRRRAARPGRPRPPRARARSGARGAAAPVGHRWRHKFRPADRRARQTTARARPRQVVPRERRSPAPRRVRYPRAKASSCRSPPHPPAGAWPVRPGHDRGTSRPGADPPRDR